MRRLFEKALVCPPGRNYPNCLSTHPEAKTINLNLARKQHNEYVRILSSQGISIEDLPAQDSLPDSVFTQDPALVGSEIVLIGRSREQARQPEAEILARYFEGQGKTIRRINDKATLEGGDILVTQDAVFVGVSGRTNLEGYREVQRCFAEVDVRPVKFSSEFFHLLSSCSYLAEDQLLVCEKYVDPSVFNDFKYLSVPPEEVVAANVLHIGGRKILMPSGYSRVRRLLQKSGYAPIEIDNSEFVKGDGRITCLSSPFYTNLA